MTSRREFLVSVALLTAMARVKRVLATPSSKTRLILLGTGAGPRPRTNGFPSAQVLVIDDQAYVVDCGDGVAGQFVRAGLRLTQLRHVFITHHHSDHNADYGNLLLLAWESGLATRVDTWGPPPLGEMTRLFMRMNAYDIRTREADEGRAPFAPLIHPHELRNGGPVFRDAHVTVTCALVDHSPVKPALAYRFDTADRSIVISGDTKPSDALVRLAKNADVLVHEAMDVAGIERLAARMPNSAALKKSILSHHTSAADAGRIATAAGVKTLVLSHFAPADDPSITDDIWANAARSTFGGTVIVGKYLMEI